MKKKLFISIVVILLGCGSLVAQKDAFFNSSFEEYRNDDIWGNKPVLPVSHGSLEDHSANIPLGNGFLLLAGMALTYSAARRRK